MDARVKVALLIRRGCRSDATATRVSDAASRLGIEITSRSTVTVVGRLTEERFRSLFGVEAVRLPALSPGESDFGAPAGHTEARDLTVPPELRADVESIAVVPPARRLR